MSAPNSYRAKLIKTLDAEAEAAAIALGGMQYSGKIAVVVSGILALSKLCREAARELERDGGPSSSDDLLAALQDARDALYNGFEPDNQCGAWHAADKILRRHGATGGKEE